jgi:hypothetical protein
MYRRTALLSVTATLLVFATNITADAQSIYKLPAGTHLRVQPDVELSSAVASVNDTFIARLSRPLVIDQTVVLPAGSTIEGRVISVAPARAFGRSGFLKVRFENLKVFDAVRPIQGELTDEIQVEKPFFLIACFVKGREARLRKDAEFEIELKREVVLPVTAY